MAIRLKIGTPELIRTSQSHQVVGLIMAILTETVMATLKDLSSQLRQLQKQIPFATAQAMTKVVRDRKSVV